MIFRDETLLDRATVTEISNPAGLSFLMFDNGAVQGVTAGPVRISLFAGSILENGCCNIYLRKRGHPHEFMPLFGPSSSSKCIVADNRFVSAGEFGEIRFQCSLSLAADASAWKWEVGLENTGRRQARLDLIYVQDVGMTAADGNEKNELYISQYVDYTVLTHPEHGPVVCCRQNELGPECVPWLALGSLDKAASYSTDGELFYGLAYRATSVPTGLVQDSLGGLVQKEMAVAAIQQEPFVLPAGRTKKTGFFGIFCPDHKERTGVHDMTLIDAGLDSISAIGEEPVLETPLFNGKAESLFSKAALFIAEDLTESELDRYFGKLRRHCEYEDGKLLSFFCGDSHHVVLREKEFLTDRPCGHILETGSGFEVDESILSCTSYMSGVFQSQLTQGNVNFNRFLSVHTNPLNVFRHTGQRIFIHWQGRYQQLAVPSAFEMSEHQCRWLYKKGGQLFEVRVCTSADSPEITLRFSVLEGAACGWIVTHHLAEENGWHMENDETAGSLRVLRFAAGEDSRPGRMYGKGFFDVCLEESSLLREVGGDECVFTDGRSRGVSCFAVIYNPCKSASIVTIGRLIPECSSRKEAEPVRIRPERIPETAAGTGLSEFLEIFPWFLHNARIHYQVPHGLEQYGGAAWGTRDVCQGPVEMLLSLGRYEPVREILARVFSNQNADGNWPQWMFDRYHQIRSAESHGDVIFWPLLAVCDYVDCSGDSAFLEEQLPFYKGDCRGSVFDHILQAFEHIKAKRFAAGTVLVDYSDGDWNDALQPKSQALKKKLISSWTVELSFQAFAALARLCRMTGKMDRAEECERICEAVRADFRKYLISDSVVSGFGLIREDRRIEPLIHPSAKSMDIHYRLLPMTRGILSGLFSLEEAQRHLAVIRQHLEGPDGVRLMDRPPRYQGGMQQYFKRAENSPFFGREIGLMYTHAHLRYAEALAAMGDADLFVKALRKAVPVNLQAVIAMTNRRQSNCYFSSSDAAFSNRYEVNEHYPDIFKGKVHFNGGWRIYSSGPGIFVKLLLSCLLGIRLRRGQILIDPIMPKEWDGLTVTADLRGRPVTLCYSVSGKGRGVRQVEVNGRPVRFSRESNPYRMGAAVVEDHLPDAGIDKTQTVLKIYL